MLCICPAGEAQKIDRIMEKFAERFCRDNPGAFHTADGAYLLSFALIMLNTDAHNPMADKNISAEDFIGMCQSSVSLGPRCAGLRVNFQVACVNAVAVAEYTTCCHSAQHIADASRHAVLQPLASQMTISRRNLRACPPALQSEDGVLEPILPPEELTTMYERILRDEFALPDGSRADPKAGKGSGPKPKAAAQLASAMGLTQLMLPFRSGT